VLPRENVYNRQATSELLSSSWKTCLGVAEPEYNMLRFFSQHLGLTVSEIKVLMEGSLLPHMNV
jgi:hypothetical protein